MRCSCPTNWLPTSTKPRRLQRSMLYVSLEFTSMVWYRTCHSHWQSSATISVPGWYEVIYCREHCNGKFFSSITLSPLLVSPACSHHSETAPSPPDYVLHPDTPDPQPALNATLPLYVILFERSYNWHRLSNDFTAAWLTFTFPQLFAVAATLKSINYNVAMTFILNNNNNHALLHYQ